MKSLRDYVMDKAIELSLKGVRKGGGPFGAVIVKDGNVVGAAHNMVTLCNDPTAHAEVMAIRNACKTLQTFSLSGCVLYSSCEPCPMCLAAAYWANIGEIVYANDREQAEDVGFSDKFIYDEFSKVNNERKIKMTKVNDSEALRAFEEWDKNVYKVRY